MMNSQETELFNRVAIVTGSNTGIGFCTAHELARRGATVVLACRNNAKAEAAAEAINHPNPSGRAIPMELDLSDLQSVRGFAENFKNRFGALNILVNNAGLNTMDNPHQYTKQRFELCFGVNYLGHFALTDLLLPLLKSSGTPTHPARIVNVSSVMHRNGRIDFENAAYHPNRDSYGTSKLCNLLHTLELQRRMHQEDANVKAFAVHPGGVRTEIWRTLPSWIAPAINAVFRIMLLSPEQGAATSIRAATDTSLHGGEYLSPYWYPKCATRFEPFFEYVSMYSGPQIVRPSQRAEDSHLAQRLWRLSKRLVDQATM